MSTTKHTAEPWHRNVSPATRYPTIFSGRNTHVCRVVVDNLPADQVEANCARIVACVNACAGMTDPAAGIAHLRERIEALERVIRDHGGHC